MPVKSYIQLVVLSGKGGTGKTTVASALSGLLDHKIVIDCDVDAANLHLVLDPVINNSFSFSGSKKAFINIDKCSRCGLCETLCSFNAISDYKIKTMDCEGCGLCYRACPEEAIDFKYVITGNYYDTTLPDSTKFYYARLTPGSGNSGKLVTEIKKVALKNVPPDKKWVIVDGPPGIGCPVNASISSADYAILVTEPTVSGIHDLKRITFLLKKLNMPYGIIINKYDLNEEVTFEIFRYADEENIPVLGTIPFSKEFVTTLIAGQNITETDTSVRNNMQDIIKQLKLQISF